MTIQFACPSCEHRVPRHEVVSRHPPSCECGRVDYPHSHRGRGMSGPDVIPHRCAFCSQELEFDRSGSIDGISYDPTRKRVVVDLDGRQALRAVASLFAPVLVRAAENAVSSVLDDMGEAASEVQRRVNEQQERLRSRRRKK